MRLRLPATASAEARIGRSMLRLREAAILLERVRVGGDDDLLALLSATIDDELNTLHATLRDLGLVRRGGP